MGHINFEQLTEGAGLLGLHAALAFGRGKGKRFDYELEKNIQRVKEGAQKEYLYVVW